MEDGIVSSVIVGVLNPEPIYEGMTYISGLAAFFPWLLVVVIAVRLLKESVSAISLKSAMYLAITDTSKTLLVFLAYTSGGTLVFLLMYGLSTLFGEFGSVAGIHAEMLDLREALTISDADTKAWYKVILEGIADTAAVPISLFIWTAFQLLSVAYVFLTQLIDVFFAIAVIGLYAWGFLVIPTMALSEGMNLSQSWIKSALTLFIWVLIEPVFLGVIWLMGAAASAFIKTTYGGFGYGTNVLMIWYLFSILIMVVVLIIRIISPFIAMYLARNDTFVGAIGGAVAAPAALIMNQILQAAAKESSIRQGLAGAVTATAPQAEGVRRRDVLAKGGQFVKDLFNTPVSDLSSRFSSGLGGGYQGSESPSGGADTATAGGASSTGSSGPSGPGHAPDVVSGAAAGNEGGSSVTSHLNTPGGEANNDLGASNVPAERSVSDSARGGGNTSGSLGGGDRPNDLSASYEEYSNLTAESPQAGPDSSGKGGENA